MCSVDAVHSWPEQNILKTVSNYIFVTIASILLLFLNGEMKTALLHIKVIFLNFEALVTSNLTKFCFLKWGQN
jgi:hypothetical protein